ncbi:uncharacterized protein LOC115226173 [Octopus sinensis]|uniref:ATP-dependent DNA helicase n=1 Tax=Octopus sinensis TaxID=2607531 RepID=A0A6P7TM33_9MOLL|nr:uncharacterized protein LOC115226173 [Octopus sinensis]
MAHKRSLEALNTTLQDIRDCPATMAGITLLLSGDFRQTLPVIPKGTRADVVRACLKCSRLWQNVTTLSPKTNIRAQLCGDQIASDFASDTLSIGNSIVQLDENGKLSLTHLCTTVSNSDELEVHDFPNLQRNYLDMNWISERAILAPKNSTVTTLNAKLLHSLPGRLHVYGSIDSVLDDDRAVNYLEVIRIPLIPSGADIPFAFRRLQFPLRLCFAMLINKSQGQTLSVAGLHLDESCFSYGQLYLGCSRVGSKESLFVYSPRGRTKNIVYQEVLV